MVVAKYNSKLKGRCLGESYRHDKVDQKTTNKQAKNPLLIETKLTSK